MYNMESYKNAQCSGNRGLSFILLTEILVDASKYVSLLEKYVASLEILYFRVFLPEIGLSGFCNGLLIKFCAFATA